MKAATTTGLLYSQTFYGPCQMPYFPSGIIRLTCTVHVAGPGGGIFPLVLKLQHLAAETAAEAAEDTIGGTVSCVPACCFGEPFEPTHPPSALPLPPFNTTYQQL